MNRKQLWLLGTGMVLLLSSVFIFKSLEEKSFESRSSRYLSERAKQKQEGNNAYRDWYTSRIVNPATGKIDQKAMIDARTKVEAIINNPAASRASISVDDWTELGPYNHGGRTRAMIIDAFNSKTLFAASVGGGLFVSYTGGNYWERVEEIAEYLTTAAICQDVDGHIYVGTGEDMYHFSGEGSGGLVGNGVYKGTRAVDGTYTWSHLEATTITSTSALQNGSDEWSSVNEIVAHPTKGGYVYAATNGGIYMTIDGGESWDRTSTTAAKIQDITIGADANGNVKIHATSSSAYMVSTDDGLTFEDATDNAGFPSIGQRAEIKVAPSDANFVYLANADNNGFLEGFYRSTDAGLNWEVITKGGSDFFEPFGQPRSATNTSGQGDYDNVIGVTADNPEEVFFGGVTLWKWTPEEGINKVAYNFNLADDRYYVHSDMHGIVADTTDANLIYFTNDGGVFASYNRGEWYTHLNAGYKTMQAYDVTVGPYGEVLAGFQDNGSHMIDIPNTKDGGVYTSSTLVSGGDGGEVDWSFVNPNAVFTASQFGNIRRSSNRGMSFNTFYDLNAAPDETLVGVDPGFGDFVTPYELWESAAGTYSDTTINQVLPSSEIQDSVRGFTANELKEVELGYDTIITELENESYFFAGLIGGVWVTKDALNFSVDPIWYKVTTFSSSINPITMDVAPDGNTIWTGATNGVIYRTTNVKTANYGYRFNGQLAYNSNSGDSTMVVNNTRFYADSVGIVNTTITTGGSGRITSVAIDPNNDEHVIVTYGGYGGAGRRIYESTNAMDSLPSWTDISGNIENWPVYDAIIDVESSSRIIIGTEFGVFQTNSTNGSSTSWEFVGPSRVAVFSLDQVSISDSINDLAATGTGHTGSIVVAGTHGRGIWATNYDICAIYGYNGLDCAAALSVEENNEEIDVLNNQVSLFPNPVVSEATLNLVVMDRSNVEIKVYNLSGALVLAEQYDNQNKGHLSYSIDMNGQKAGIYVVNTTVNGKVYQNKMIKLN